MFFQNPPFQRSFKLVFDKYESETDKDFAEVKAEILNTTGETVINVHINVIKDLDDLQLNVNLLMEETTDNFVSLLNRTVNFCKFLKTKSIDPVLRIIYDDLSRHGYFFKECPIKKGIYYIHDYRLDEEMLPSYIPEARFIFSLELWKKTALVHRGNLYGRVDKSKGFNNFKIFSMGK